MGPYLRGVVPVLGAWGYSRGGQPVELFYAMPSMGPAFCSLADAFLPKSLTRQVPAAPGVETDMCASRVFIRDMWRGSRVVPWPRQGLPFGMVLVLVLKMLEVALLLHDQGAVHADIKSANWVLDPRPLAASAQRLLEAAAAAGALGGQAGYELLTAAFQDLMQVAATLEVRVEMQGDHPMRASMSTVCAPTPHPHAHKRNTTSLAVVAGDLHAHVLQLLSVSCFSRVSGLAASMGTTASIGMLHSSSRSCTASNSTSAAFAAVQCRW
jgi:hypothetical protein